MRPTSEDVQEQAEQLVEPSSLALSRIVDGYKIGMRGLSCAADGTDCLDGAEFARRLQAYRESVDALGRVDLLILIGATESMQPYFSAVADAVAEFARAQVAARAETPLDLRVSFAVYGDYETPVASPQSVAFETVARFHDPRVDGRGMSRLRDFVAAYGARAPRDRNGDLHEASLAAIARAAAEADWRSDAGFRAIIHLADHGSRPLGETSCEGGSTLVERVGTRDVGDLLEAGKLMYIPISVFGRGGDEGPAGKRARAAFKDQALEILRARELQPLVLTSYGQGSSNETDGDRVRAVLAALDELNLYRIAAEQRARHEESESES